MHNINENDNKQNKQRELKKALCSQFFQLEFAKNFEQMNLLLYQLENL